MELIPGGKDNSAEMQEAYKTPARGELGEIVGAIESQTGQSVAGLLEQLNIEDNYIGRVTDSLSRAAYRICEGESIATDLDLKFRGNLADQLAELRGIDSVKIHLSVFDAMRDTARHVPLEGVSPQQLTWAWEIGRYVGRTLQRHVDAHIAPLSIPGNLGILNFFEKVALDLFGDSYDFEFPATGQIKPGAIEDYRQNGLPERLASTLGGLYMQYLHGIDEEFVEVFNARLREVVVRPYNLAEDFGTEFRPEICYRELAASHPLTSEELENYLEYISEPSDTIYLRDR